MAEASGNPLVTASERPRTAGRPRSPVASSGQIANAVVDLIGERGLQGWSMRDLAARLSLSTGTITHYYRDKQALLISAIDAVYLLPADWDRYRALPVPAQLRHMTDLFVLDDERKRRWGRFWLAFMAGAGHDDVLRAHQEERYERQRRFYARLIAAGIAAGALRSELDADRAAVRLVALGNGLAMEQVAAPGCLSPATARVLLDEYLAELERPPGVEEA